MSDLVCPLFFINLPTTFFVRVSPPWRVSSGAVRPHRPPVTPLWVYDHLGNIAVRGKPLFVATGGMFPLPPKYARYTGSVRARLAYSNNNNLPLLHYTTAYTPLRICCHAEQERYSSDNGPSVTRESHSFTCHPYTNHCTPSHRASPPFGSYSLLLPTKGWPGWVDLDGWLDTGIIVTHGELNPDTVTQLGTNRARRRLYTWTEDLLASYNRTETF